MAEIKRFEVRVPVLAWVVCEVITDGGKEAALVLARQRVETEAGQHSSRFHVSDRIVLGDDPLMKRAQCRRADVEPLEVVLMRAQTQTLNGIVVETFAGGHEVWALFSGCEGEAPHLEGVFFSEAAADQARTARLPDEDYPLYGPDGDVQIYPALLDGDGDVVSADHPRVHTHAQLRAVLAGELTEDDLSGGV